MNCTRRRFIDLIGCLSALSLILEPGRADAGSGQLHLDAIAKTLRGLVYDRGIARRLGERYRDQCPDERDEAALVRLILGAMYFDGTAQKLPGKGPSYADLNARVRTEFSAGDTINVSGWVLARTEARLCALCC